MLHVRWRRSLGLLQSGVRRMPPPPEESLPQKSLQEIVQELGLYSLDAFAFVQEGLAYTVKKIHGGESPRSKKAAAPALPEKSRHIGGRELCDGLRELALSKWGLMARAVLARWGVTSTLDFGRIVFAMVDSGWMQKTDEDSLEDFRNVYDFKTAFDAGYKIEHK
jgi:uncharacterized repeat protein (TIGR04138 family)